MTADLTSSPVAADLRPRVFRALRFGARAILEFLTWEVLAAGLMGRRRAAQSRLARMTGLARRFRGLALDLGGVWIKLGQFLSSRVDILPPEVVVELAGLQDAVPPERPGSAEALIERELGRPVGDLFDAFETEPLAAASFGQVHRARIKGSGERIVVKVQRPRLDEIVGADLRALTIIAGWIRHYPPLRRRADLGALVREFSAGVAAELDYEQEALNAQQFAANFSRDRGVLIPRPIKHLSTRRVLTLEDVEYIKITDVVALEAAGISPRAVARKLFETYLQQVLTDGFFHADPHPGNLFAQPVRDGSSTQPVPVEDGDHPLWNGVVAFATGLVAGLQGQPSPASPAGDDGLPFRLVFVDFGMMGTVSDAQRYELRELILGVALRDAARIALASQKMGFLLPGADLRRIEQAIAVTFDAFWGRTMEDLTRVGFDQMLAFARQFRDLLFTLPFQIPQDVLYLGRAANILSGMSMSLDPGFNVWTSLQPFAVAAASPSGLASPRALLSAAIDFARRLIQAPGQAETFYRRALAGELTFKAERPSAGGGRGVIAGRIGLGLAVTGMAGAAAALVLGGDPGGWWLAGASVLGLARLATLTE